MLGWQVLTRCFWLFLSFGRQIALNVDVNNTAAIKAGVVLGSYLNKITGDELDIVVHPNLPAGTYLFYSQRLPAYVQGIGNLPVDTSSIPAAWRAVASSSRPSLS